MTLTPRIIVVDDDDNVREAIADLCRDDGIDVVATAADGVDAVAAAARLSPDVVVMDMRMPRMNGIDATREIRTSMPRIAVIVVSAYEDPALSRAALAAGAADYLVKGSAHHTLCSSIRALADAAGTEGTPG